MTVRLIRRPDGTLFFRACVMGIVGDHEQRDVAMRIACKNFLKMRKAGAV